VDSFDLLIIGGGINGTAIARDAATRGMSVLLVERDDLAQHTSSASSKLIHGGLRYLEYGEVRLVRESLREREILLERAPHIVRPLRFVLPHGPGMRPWWMLRAGLKLYDLLAGRTVLPRSRSVRRDEAALLAPLRDAKRAAVYHDAWVDDARLVVLNAVAAAEAGAQIATRTALLSARRDGGVWRASLGDGRRVSAKAIVNAAGPWVSEVLGARFGRNSGSRVRLIKGSHIVVPRLYEGDHAYILQQPDGRVVFALPYGAHNLIGTTDVMANQPDDPAYLGRGDRLSLRGREPLVSRGRPARTIWSGAIPASAHCTTMARRMRRRSRATTGSKLDAAPGPSSSRCSAARSPRRARWPRRRCTSLGQRGGRSRRRRPLPGRRRGCARL
jgi:glycerol-3-phosphate dehydrogenase